MNNAAFLFMGTFFRLLLACKSMDPTSSFVVRTGCLQINGKGFRQQVAPNSGKLENHGFFALFYLHTTRMMPFTTIMHPFLKISLL
jgi:hypothetical protein